MHDRNSCRWRSKQVQVGLSAFPRGKDNNAGKSSAGADHRGQVLLYTLMLSSLEGSDEPGATDALLVYAKDGATHTVGANYPFFSSVGVWSLTFAGS